MKLEGEEGNLTCPFCRRTGLNNIFECVCELSDIHTGSPVEDKNNMKILYTTSLPVSQRIKELIGEQDSEYSHFETFDRDDIPRFNRRKGCAACSLPKQSFENEYRAFTISELPEVLKKVGEKLGWRDYKYHCTDNRELWLYHYLKCCELHALGQSVDNYLMELLK